MTVKCHHMYAAMALACRRGEQVLHMSGCALDAVVAAITVLEASPALLCSDTVATSLRSNHSNHLTSHDDLSSSFSVMGTGSPSMLKERLGMQNAPMCNAGAGSNLTLGGHAECDASVMAGDGAFGAVGAVSGR